MKHKKLNFIVSISSLVLGFVGLIVSLIFYIKSRTSYEEDWELSNGNQFYAMGVSYNMDFAIAMVVTVIVLAFGAYLLYKILKFKEINMNSYLVLGTVVTGLVGFYALQAFFKPLIKAVVKGKDFAYFDYHIYLYISYVCLIVFNLFIVLDVLAYIKYKKNLAY